MYLLPPRSSASSVSSQKAVRMESGTLRLERAVKAPLLHRRAMPTCEEIGRCKKGERQMVIPSPDVASLLDAQRKGCTIKRLFRSGVSVLCPSTASLPQAKTERIFQVLDVLSNEQIGAASVQASGVTGAGVRVAVLDTGVDASHPELQGRVVAQAVFTDDGSADTIGHGTHVAGIIAGQGVQAVEGGGQVNRALGVSPGASILSGKVCGSDGWCSEGDILAGISWAVGQKASVINLSLGGATYASHCDDDLLAQEVNWAVSRGVTVVAAAGNAGTEGVSTPACASSAIAVGAVDASDVRASWSNYGGALDVVAPGVGILSPVSCLSAGSCPVASYGWWSGTSMATPQVTGLVALLLQANPSLTPAAVSRALTSTAKDLGTVGADLFYGYGRVDAVAAVAAATQAGSSSGARSSSSASLGSSSRSSLASSMPANSSSSSSAVRSSASAMSSRMSGSVSSRSSRNFSSRSFSSAREDREENHEQEEDFAEKERGQERNERADDRPACTVKAWACEPFNDCTWEGRQERKCALVDSQCRDAEATRPPLQRMCVPPGQVRKTESDKDAEEPVNANVPRKLVPGR
ncbi:MAG: S8 family peptidase [Candidatus Peribacteraceae bacterium]|nr:S8 family peptidase [Candidatus Peribacteraceae bacterium]